ncbi:hypothetical protein ACFVHB_17830 [Kitasatospora sp. NPDC127111]|uniref:hypothetical protein n=1 Tax=Kitasatospora sp. NPDC127111 TaxID=3345363 RepID=UPI003624BE2B
MAASPPPRRRAGAAPPRAVRPTTAAPTTGALSALLTVLTALAALVLTACGAPGELRDHGPAQRVTPPPVPQPLWSGLAVAPPPTSPAPGASRSSEPPPQPVPDVTVPGPDVAAVDVRAVLAKDPGVSQDERRALDACPGCEVRAPEFRDLTGDGRPELIVAVGTVGPVVLHVYTTAGDHLLPVLRVQVLKGFGAETVGADLWLHEPTTVSTRTSSHYRWDGTRLGLLEQRVEGIGPITGPGQGSTSDQEATPPTTPGPKASRPWDPAATGRPQATPVPGGTGWAATPQPQGGAGLVVPRPAASQPARPTAAPPEAKP